MPTPNIGLDDNIRKSVADSLTILLADTQATYTLAHSYHWNVTGLQFQQLHTLFEEQYRENWDALDEIAERIRALGEIVQGYGASLADRSIIASPQTEPPAAQDMVRDLLDGNETLIRRAREALSVAEEAGDAASADLITVRIQAHEKAAWMLRATLE